MRTQVKGYRASRSAIGERAMKLQEPPLGRDLAGLDPLLLAVVDKDAHDLMSALRRSSRYANISKSRKEVSYSRRVTMLGIAEMAIEEPDSGTFATWLSSWLKEVDPELERALLKADRTPAVAEALEINRKIVVSSGLGGALERAGEIAHKASGRPAIDLRHLLFAISENPGRAFHSFGRQPNENQLGALRTMIVEHARERRPDENFEAWQAFLEGRSPDDSTDVDIGGPIETPDGGSDDGGSDDGGSDDGGNGGAGAGSDPDGGAPTGDDEDSGTGPDAGAGTIETPKPEAPEEAGTEFVDDDAELDDDRLERSVLALSLGRRLHTIWRRANDRPNSPADPRAAHDGSRAAFVLHLDAPWGGGKTTFANFLTRVLNPCPAGARPAGFLRERYGDEADLGGIFLDDPPANAKKLAELAAMPREFRRPWITVYFNAWQREHIKPPWWAFYQAIRQSCFEAIRRDGDAPWEPAARPAAGWRSRVQRWWRKAKGFDQWLGLWIDEFRWRFTNPKIYSLFLTALLSLGLLWILWSTGAWGVTKGKDGPTAGYILSNSLGVILTGVGGVTGLWALGALLKESIVPGTDTLAERLNLGSGDPFGRFRRHFVRTMERVRRPVLVVVDDLDRCQPAFVVDLIRGMQTLLRSPRVVFAILGDREWIERAFESEHASMSKLDVGPEQSFGARFVEKAIQMSFILPALGDEARLGYVRHVVRGKRADARRPKTVRLDPVAAAKLREFVNEEAKSKELSTFDTGSILSRVGERLWDAALGSGEGRSVGDVLEEAGVGKQSPALEQLVNDTLAIHAATDADAEKDVRHELEHFARFFPANPRQIKRIVNSITIYHSVAIQRPDIPTDAYFRAQLAIWIIMMTEWPQTWRLVASYPDLVKVLVAADPMKALEDPLLILPGSVKATSAVLKPILDDHELLALITGKTIGPGHDPLDPEHVAQLIQLTPLHSRVRRLAEPQAVEDRRARSTASAETA